MEIILAAIAIYLIYLLIRHVIIPIASVLAVVVLGVSAVYALVISLTSFIKSFKNNLDPYKTFVDTKADMVAGVKRNYCFGPGFHQVSEIVKGAFKNLEEYRKSLTEWKNNSIRHKWIIDIWVYMGYIFSILCAQILGFIWVSAFSIVLSTVIIMGMMVFFTFFSTLWLTDRVVLILKSIHNRCPNCKRKTVIPAFICPTCGLNHKRLVPGPYGVMKRKCLCGTQLSTTFIGGRSEYEAHCPFCDAALYSSDSQQYGIQLVGGVGTGKTTFLAAFWHEYKEMLNQHHHGMSFEETPKDGFELLENWFNTGASESTLETNANMYSIIHKVDSKTSVQLTVYDIAGEAFDFAGSDTQQQQFRYCEGFIIVVDPTATTNYISETITNFLSSWDAIKGKHTSKTASVPVSVIITKSDQYKKEIGIPHIRSSYKNVFDTEHETTYEQHQSNICRSFLLEHGYGNAVNLIESAFSNIRYFPVSAMGHSAEDGQYEPWGVIEPVFWLMNTGDCPLRNIVRQ